MNVKISYNQIHELIYYNPETGKIFAKQHTLMWKKDTELGWVSGRNKFKSLKLMIEGKIYEVTYLIYLLMTKLHPDNLIDYVDGNRLNNKWENLRLATYSQNSCNRKLNYEKTSTGIKGVYLVYRRGIARYRARIRLNIRTSKPIDKNEGFLF